MSTAVSDKKNVQEVKKRLLEKHTLEAVFSMPDDLFHPVGVNTCILVFKAYNPHTKGKKSFFGYFKNDGLVKQKNSGRVDKNNKWKEIKEKWLSVYHNKDNIAGLSVKQEIIAEDEWCAEAYMETDYSTLTEEDFIKVIRDFVGFLFAHSYILEASSKSIIKTTPPLNRQNWKSFKIGELFKLEKAKCGNASELLSDGNDIFYIGAKKNENGIMNKVQTAENLTSKGNAICFIGDGQGSIGYTTYQPFDFIGTTTLTVGYNKELNRYNAMFLVAILDQERYRYSFGRKYSKTTINNAKIKLPATPKGEPDWEFMENYIRSLPYSSAL